MDTFVENSKIAMGSHNPLNSLHEKDKEVAWQAYDDRMFEDLVITANVSLRKLIGFIRCSERILLATIGS